MAFAQNVYALGAVADDAAQNAVNKAIGLVATKVMGHFDSLIDDHRILYALLKEQLIEGETQDIAIH